MLNPKTLFPSSSNDPQGSPILQSPYTPLLNGPQPRRPTKELLVILCGLLLLVSLVAYNGYRASNVHGQVSSLNEEHDDNPKTVPSSSSSTWYPVSRGVSEGVSEKSNRLFSSNNNGESEYYPWNNSMLSWQRTAFHFQPEKNWMNGNSDHFSAFFFKWICFVLSLICSPITQLKLLTLQIKTSMLSFVLYANISTLLFLLC